MNRPVGKVVVVARTGSDRPLELASRIGGWLKERGVSVQFDLATSTALGLRNGVRRDAIPKKTDLVIAAGGDGTLLSIARSVSPQGIPILGVNMGSMGFLTELQPDELLPNLDKVVSGDYRIEERATLRVRLMHGDQALNEHMALNDVVVTKSALARMIGLELWLDQNRMASYTSDGLILATPTGSTAYSLSAGGPVLDPEVDAFVVTPICPHSMAYRPTVIPGNTSIQVALKEGTHEEVYVTLDGQIGFPISHQDVLHVDRHPAPVRLLRLSDRSFYEVLRTKLKWGER
ncbi:MAG: NAD(+)/NADH kinase [Acidobacteria bacterium]|uniref:NAD kinase n=1 Tax=Candidatus Polarisedimenticola svalbardensis TaxID=2886004 RepID=A0A8J6XWW4_9BACT|nr:NAD(+)/NADH kinase [Candidatus Polarisedimenticola svalbardensis]